MMDSGSISCFPNIASHHFDQMFLEDHHLASFSMDVSGPTTSSSDAEMQSNSLFYNLSVLKEKSHQVQSLVTVLTSPEHQPHQQTESTSLAIANMGSLVEDIIGAASSIMLTCNSLSASTPPDHNELHNEQQSVNLPDNSQYNFDVIGSQGLNFAAQTIDWYNGDQNSNPRINRDGTIVHISHHKVPKKADRRQGVNPFVNSYKDYDLIEIDAADLLAKFTHYCEICGKGFKRDANLRMHMRAHGDLYKNSSSDLTSPLKKSGNNIQSDEGNCSIELRPKKYSCPQEGCRWNRKHYKFQPLKSMICVKNHYKRSHCPKMYVCKRCNMKQFSVLSDLRTHEKHCGDQKWQCSCGTTFSRKDKLMGHVALFVGHTPLIAMINSSGRLELHQAGYC